MVHRTGLVSPQKAGTEAILFIEVIIGGLVVHWTGMMSPRKERILHISSNDYLGALGL